ncbi:MAG: NAD(P)H-dependent glycerol-3-phosphate dehydrogenase [Pseudomonadales bacterium]
MMSVHRIAVIGGGSFGTALASLMGSNKHTVQLWLRDEVVADAINREHCNKKYLPDLILPESVVATTDLAVAVTGADIVFMAVPSKSCREVARTLAPHIQSEAMLISTTKGIEADSFKLMSEVLAEEIDHVRIGVMSGPNLAREIADQQLTGTVIASLDEELNRTVQEVLRSSYFRVYAGNDMYGVELAGALKNIYAIIAGMAKALAVGENTLGLLLTRSLAEMSRFAERKGANPMTFIGLAGVGDLIVTCLSPLSRNYRVGYSLGEGRDLDEVVAELGQVAEGVNTLQLVKAEADQLGVYMPLMDGLYQFIYNHKSVDEVIGSMMSAEQNSDVEFAHGNLQD